MLSARVAHSRLVASKDNRTLFIEAMVDPLKRHIAFNVVERNCSKRFGEGDEGELLLSGLLMIPVVFGDDVFFALPCCLVPLDISVEVDPKPNVTA